MVKALEYSRQGVLLALLLTCVYTDLARGRIYNWATLPALLLGLAFAFMLEGAAASRPHLRSEFVHCLMAAALGGGVLFVVYLFGGFGAGDVKLMAAAGALYADWRLTLFALMYAAAVGAAMAVGVLIWRGRLLEGLKRSARLLVTFRRSARAVEAREEIYLPYGFAISAGALWAWIQWLPSISKRLA
jgi:prepilin peptidase CpaA